MNEAIANVNTVSSQLQSTRESLQAEIGRVFDALASALERRRRELLEEVAERERAKQNTLGETGN